MQTHQCLNVCLDALAEIVKKECGYGWSYVSFNKPHFKKAINILCKHGKMKRKTETETLTGYKHISFDFIREGK